MKRFIELFREVLEIENLSIDKNTVFRNLDEWDSLTVLSLLAMVSDEYDKAISRDELRNAKTVEDLFNIISQKDND